MSTAYLKKSTFVFLFALFAAGSTWAGQGIVSTMANVDAVMETRGFYIVPVKDRAPVQVPGDLAPAQLYEIIRPRGEPITLGRLFTSCSCVQLEASKKAFSKGERAFVTLRNVRATPPNGQRYAFYIQVSTPLRETLRFDTYMQSDRFLQSSTPAPVAPQPYTGPVTVQTYTQPATVQSYDQRYGYSW